MYDSGYASSKKRATNYGDDTTYLRTSEKIQYQHEPAGFQDHTPQRSPYRPNVNPQGSRLQSARRSINEAIQLVSDKKRMNQEAIGEVRAVNQEIVSSFTGFNQFRNRTPEPSGRINPVDMTTTSQFDFRPVDPRNPTRNQGFEGGSQDNAELRNRLNDQLKKNNEMLRYISSLESQNTQLRSSYQGPNMNTLMEENRSLRNQLANATSNAPYNLVQELQRLKQENNELRKETVTLLKTKQQYN